ncbi:MAG: CRISPR-associated endonuclease Cas1 [Burkholderiales bacterium]|nr:CRISPR-associated endonuclease Cas1 [Burkholderiales bacterium]
MIEEAALLAAWQRLARTVAREQYRFDRAVRVRLEHNPTGVCHVLAAQVKEGSYRPQPLRVTALPKPDGGTRTLMVPCLLDRLVQSALAARLTDVLDNTFHDQSFAYRPRRSVQAARASVHAALAAGHRWVLDADIRSCFDEILHAPLIERLKTLGVWQHQTAALLRRVLRAEVAPPMPPAVAAGPFCLARGLPQGSPLSPLLCNVTLHALDEAFAANGVHFVRYADDFVAFADDEAGAAAAQALAQATLNPLGLSLHPKKTRVIAVDAGFRFLGAEFGGEPDTAAFTQPDENAVAAAEMGADSRERLPVTEFGFAADRTEISNAIEHTPAGPTTREVPSTADAQRTIDGAGTPGADDGAPLVDGSRDEAESAEPLLRTLYLLEPRVTLERDGGTLVAIAPGRETIRIPAARLHQVMAFGETNLTSGAIALCLEQNIPVMLLAGRGKYFGVIDPIRIDNVARQRAQFNALDDDAMCRRLRNGMISGKLHNSAQMLRRWARSRNSPVLDGAVERVALAANTAHNADTEATLRGIEGAAAAEYFGAVAAMVPAAWGFAGRKRQPPPDPVNSLLSYGYVLLYYNLLTLVVSRGLHPHLGFFHATRSGHYALVSDLMEEFRAPIVDGLVLDIVSHGRLTPEDFSWPTAADEPCLMSGAARRAYVHAFERRLNKPFKLAGEAVGMDFRRRMDAQVLHLCGVLDGSYAQYLPFRLKA